LTQLELAELFGCDRNTLATWTRSGMPVVRRGRGSRGHEYDAAQCVQWVLARDRARHEQALATAKASSAVSDARARKLNAEAQRAEFQQRKLAGELVCAADVEAR
jgi:phage terminase Nu1 subunit (DNA packaging protein)